MAVSSGSHLYAALFLGTTVLMALPSPIVADTINAPHAHKKVTVRAGQKQQHKIAPSMRAAAPGAEVRAAKAKRVLSAPQSFNASQAESITVTGSMLGAGKNVDPNPVQEVTAAQIEKTGATNLSNFFTRLPSVGSSGLGNNNPNGGAGVSCTDLRNLGLTRVLVLIDGKRTTVNGNSNCVDLNSIPLDQVKSVEILKDGGSELYGADAVSGVINIKMRHDVGYGSIDIYGGISQYGDAPVGRLSAFKGWNFDHGKGNITLFGQYLTQSGIMARNRDWARNPQMNNPVSGTPSFGSSLTPNGQFQTADGNSFTTTNGGQSFQPYTSKDNYNFNRLSSLTSSFQNASLSGDAHYDFNKHFSLYSNVLYSHRTSDSFLAPEPILGSIPPSLYASNVTVPADYPGNTFGQDVTAYKRIAEWGPRRNEYATDTVTAQWGAKGEAFDKWMYDVSETWGQNDERAQMINAGNYASLLNVWGLRAANPSDPNSSLIYDPSFCMASAGCSFSNIFGQLSPGSARYSNLTTVTNTSYTFHDLNFRVHKNDVVKMPWKNGGSLGIAFGMEHRDESISYRPDKYISSGQAATNVQSATQGGFNVSEGYLEGKLQLLKDADYAKDLTIDGQGRFSSYNTFGTTKNWKVGINWSPSRDIRFRGTLGTSFRQPSVWNLYGGQAVSYEQAFDPCAQVGSYGANSGNVAAACARAGLSPNFQQVGNAQVQSLQGGNPQVQPEVGRTYTFGTVLTPRQIPNLMVSVEYWHYTVKDVISQLGTQYILDQCYAQNSAGYCADVQRNASTGQIQAVQALWGNNGSLRTGGIDFDLDYAIRLTRHDRLLLSNNFQGLVSYERQWNNGGPWFNYTGRLLYNNDSGQPRVRDYATLTWRHKDFSLTYMMQYVGGMVWNDQTNDITAQTGGRHSTPGIFSHDLTASYHLNQWNFTVGVNNLFDKKPPFVVSAGTNTNVFQYGYLMLGRNVFGQIGLEF